MKVLGVMGSPRKKGITSTLARRFLKTASKLGAEVEAYNLNSMKYSGCQSCNTCKTGSERCIIKDDLTPLLEGIHSCDLLVLATPVYYGDVSGQFKLFFDRTFAYFDENFDSRIAPGKQAVMILAQGNPDHFLFADIHPRYQHWLDSYGFESCELLRFCGSRQDTDGEKLHAAMHKVDELAKLMLK